MGNIGRGYIRFYVSLPAELEEMRQLEQLHGELIKKIMTEADNDTKRSFLKAMIGSTDDSL